MNNRHARLSGALASVSIPLLAAALMACSSDLFHGTDWQSACDSDPDKAGCPGAEPPTTSTSVSAASSGATSTAVASGAGGAGTGGAGGAGGGSGGEGGAGECGSSVSCAKCEDCAAGGPCAAEASACEQNPECGLLLDCYLSCPAGNQMCTDQCVTNHSGGIGEAGDLYVCVECGECAALMCDTALLCD